MAFDDAKSDAAHAFSLALLAGGVGVAGYKAYQEGALSKLQRAVEIAQNKGSSGASSLGLVSRTPHEFEEASLEKAFSVMDDVMSPAGREEFLRRTYTRAMYSTRVLTDDARKTVVDNLLKAGTNWSAVKGVLERHQADLGGLENVHRMMRELAGGTVRGSRGESLDELLRGMSPIGRGANTNPRAAGYTRSAFEPGGSYWRDLFPGESNLFEVSESTILQQRHGILPKFNQAARKIEEQLTSLGVRTIKNGVPIKVAAGLRDATDNTFRGGMSASFKTNIAGVGDVDVPFYQVRFGGRNSGAVLNVPVVSEVKGLNVVATDPMGRSFGVLPHFAIPKEGGGVRIVSAQEGINAILHGNAEAGIPGLALRLQQYHSKGKTYRDLVRDTNSMISSVLYRVHGATDSSTTLARLHSQSVVHLGHLVAGEAPETMEQIAGYYQDLKAAAQGTRWDIGALASPDPMAKAYHLSLYDMSKRWDVYGSHYPVEKRYLQRFRGEFSLSERASKAMGANPIFGILGRGSPITMTERGMAGAYQMPMVVGAYKIKGQALNLGEEEAILSRDLASMMETRTTRQLTVKASNGIGTIGDELMEGEIIGTDYVTGETYKAQRRPGRVSERIVKGEKVGDVAYLTLETTFPGQDFTKVHGNKAVYHLAREDHGVAKEAFHEFNIKRMEQGGLLHTMLGKNKVEFLAHAGILKGGMGDVLKQMTEAAWIVGAQKPEILHARNMAEVQSSRGALWEFVHRDDIRRGMMQAWNREGAGLTGMNSAEGVGVQILGYAKKMGFTPEEMGLIGGLYLNKIDEGSKGSVAAALTKAGLTKADITAMEGAEVVLGLPTMWVGEYGSQRWQNARMDPRALNELAARMGGTTPGDLLVRELARRVEPEQNFNEMNRALKSALGDYSGIPPELKKIKSIEEAKKALGREGFMFEGPGGNVYMPGPQAKGMRDFYHEIGAEPLSEHLKSSYMKYLNAVGAEGAGAGAIDEAKVGLLKQLEMEWQKSSSVRGNIIGAEAQMARRWLGAAPEQSMAKTFDSIGEFSKASDAFTIGLGKEPAERMFREMLASNMTQEEKAFIKAQRDAFFKGESITGVLWRHPTMRPQSLVAAQFQYVKNAPEGMFFKNYQVNAYGKNYDVSLAQGMKLDYDADRAYAMFIGNEKVKRSLDEMMRSEAYRSGFVEDVVASTNLQKVAKDFANRMKSSAGGSDFLEGLKRMVAVKMETGQISSLASKMRSAVGYSGSEASYDLADFVISELEEAPISSKHGMAVAQAREALFNFINNKGSNNDEGLRALWMQVWGQEEVQAGKRTFKLENFITDMTKARDEAKNSEHFAAYQATVRRQSAAAGGRQLEESNLKNLSREISRAMSFFEDSRGSPTASLMRELRMGPGSAISTSRELLAEAKGGVGYALRAFGKHWKYPAMAVAGAMAVNWMAGAGEMKAPQQDPNARATELAQGSVPRIQVGSPFTTRTILAGGDGAGAGYQMSTGGDYDSQGFRQLSSLGAELGANIRIRDDRGAITPEYIDKAERERYY